MLGHPASARDAERLPPNLTGHGRTLGYSVRVADAEKVKRIFARQASTYDRSVAVPALEEMRASLFSIARGKVLEVGVGTGLNFRHYPSNLTGLVGVDISEPMLAQAREKARGLPYPVDLQNADLADWSPETASFDTITSSLALCGVPDPVQLLVRLRSALRPGGRLLALEHVRPPAPLSLLADALDGLWDHVVGCHINRPTARLLEEAGYVVRVVERRLAGVLVSVVADATP
jgi:ubiquinone/menaquinone biosynthesis C-methylase UbiE